MHGTMGSLLLCGVSAYTSLGGCGALFQSRRASGPECIFRSPFPPPDLPEEHVRQLEEPGSLDSVFEYQSSSWPLRTMIFIDGSWLYYSLHGRRPNCPVTRKYGEGWEYSHSIDFDRLPQLIAQRLHKEMLERFKTQRFVEVVRSVAFASMRADTDVQSPRKRLFKGMEKANYDVHLSTTVGHQEKCIDIALAVEMMHYASLPGAYDVAVLVSGDKDFMPALSRIRTKGKRVAICSMRNCCSHDLLGPQAHVRDFEPIWLDDHLDYLIRPKADALAPGAPQSTASELLRLVKEVIRERTLAGQSPVSSRDIGRFLQASATDDHGWPRMATDGL